MRPYAHLSNDALDYELARVLAVVDPCTSDSVYLDRLEAEEEFRWIEKQNKKRLEAEDAK